MKGSIIIPTFGRSDDVVSQTIRSLVNLGDEFFENILEIILVDQNKTSLDLHKSLSQLKDYNDERIKILKKCRICDDDHPFETLRNSIPLFHVVGISPSTTIAKNYAISKSKGDVILFFDDDIEAHPGVIRAHLNFQKTTPYIGILGGREVINSNLGIKRSKLKNWLSFLADHFINSKSENNYKINGEYVGRIHPLSFFFCRFDLLSDYLVPVNTIRGCNASCRRVVFDSVNGFDENFQGSALREESDFSLRIEKNGFKNYYYGNASVTHHRQLGGCNNLSKSIQTFLSKLDNEVYFQQKHFSHLSPFYFFIRLLPFALENMPSSFGLSLFFLIRYTILVKKKSR